MEKQIVFFDLDGTLLDDEKNIPASTKEAVSQLQEQGIFTAIATGRAPFMFTDIQKELGIDMAVSINGQYVFHKETVVFKNPLQREQLRLLEERAEGKNHPMVFLDHLGMRANTAGHPHIEKSLTDLKLTYPEVDREFHLQNDIYQALLFCEQKDDLLYNVKDRDFDFIRWHKFSMDVIPPGSSKAYGIQQLLQHLSIKKENTFAFGDALNDVEMLSFVGTGIAMGNGRDEAKRAADIVTKRVSDQGIEHGLHEVGLLE